MVGCRAGGRRSEGGRVRSSGGVMARGRAAAGRQRAQQVRTAAAVLPCSALRSGSREAEQRREKGGRERERVDFDFSQNFQWKLEKV